jgi:hypothetical protein
MGGGGTHIVQQLAHIGFQNYVLYDDDIIEESNLNRLVGGTVLDVELESPKINIAIRTIRGLQPTAIIYPYRTKWQLKPRLLRTCDIIFGCVDGYQTRRHELEVMCRRYLIPYIDIGLDVHHVEGHPPRMAGQVILSMPDGPCMHCLGFLSEEKLNEEAQKYGAAGEHPQVVWANGNLDSTAVGVGVDLLTDWSKLLRSTVYLAYDGNLGTMSPHPRLEYIPNQCKHFTRDQVGDVIL